MIVRAIALALPVISLSHIIQCLLIRSKTISIAFLKSRLRVLRLTHATLSQMLNLRIKSAFVLIHIKVHCVRNVQVDMKKIGKFRIQRIHTPFVKQLTKTSWNATD